MQVCLCGMCVYMCVHMHKCTEKYKEWKDLWTVVGYVPIGYTHVHMLACLFSRRVTWLYNRYSIYPRIYTTCLIRNQNLRRAHFFFLGSVALSALTG